MSMLNLDDISGPEFEKYIDDFIKFTEKLRQLNLENYNPTINVHPIINSTRKDQVKVDFTKDELFANTDTTEDGYILVPRIIEDN